MKIQMNKLLLGALVVAGSICFSSCSDEWDDHYATSSPSTEGMNLWETLKSNPNYSIFADTLAKRGYDAILKSNRIYTVFAPTNEAMQNFQMNGDLIKDEFIKNHIAYFYHNVYPQQDTVVQMLNKKMMRIRQDYFGEKADPEIAVTERNVPSRNGLLQGLNQVVPYLPNIWEHIGKETDSLRKYLYSYNVIELNTNESTPGYINSDGQMVYLDSVTYLRNPMWSRTGYLNNEDSTYVSMILDDNAWKEGYDKIEKNFRYYPDLQGEFFLEGDVQASKDSLARYKEAIIKLYLTANLNFRKSVMETGANDPKVDFYRTTGKMRVPKTVVNNWINNASKTIKASNGTAYLTHTFDYDAADVWQDTLTAEGESATALYSLGTTQMSISYNRLNTDTLSISPLSTDYEPGAKYEVSGGRYAAVQQAVSRVASVSYGVANTLSGKYDVWVTFIPSSVVPGIEAKPSSVRGTIKYCQVNNNRITTKSYQMSTFDLDAKAVTRIKVAEALELEPSFNGFLSGSDYLYSETSTGVKTDLFSKKYGFFITLTNATNLRDETTDHNLYIDCIELVPHREN